MNIYKITVLLGDRKTGGRLRRRTRTILVEATTPVSAEVIGMRILAEDDRMKPVRITETVLHYVQDQLPLEQTDPRIRT